MSISSNFWGKCMKKGLKNFLVFLVTAVTATCIGSVFYQFAKNDEVITVSANTVYINYGESLSLDDIGFSRKKADKHTKIDFNAGGEEVTSIIKFDEVNQRYITTAKGGSTTIKITTTNSKYKSFSINVFVGLGSEDCPYYISNEQQLFNIGELFDINSYFTLVNDITITDEHLPIGTNLIEDKYNYREFNGKFNGQFKTISNFNTTLGDYAGLFGIIGANGLVRDLTVKNFDINGSFTNAGAIAGISHGTISKIEVIDSNINNISEDAASVTGGIVGLLQTDHTNSTNSIATIISSMATSHNDSVVASNGIVGGIAGISEGAKIHACYTHLNLRNNGVTIGGLVGKLVVNDNSYIYESYSISSVTQASAGKAGNIVGEIVLAEDVTLDNIDAKMVLLGNYFNNEANSFNGVGVDSNNIASSTSFAVTGRTKSDLKLKSTYIYFLESADNIVYWDGLWSLAHGYFPVIEKANVTAINPSISETTSQTSTLIGSKEELLAKFNTENVSGNFIITNNIDLGGMVWNPVNFKGTFKADENKSYTISNFKIKSTSKYVGFFSILTEATISNITFSDVEILENDTHETVGVVAGYILGNTNIDNIHVNFANISTNAIYVGGIAGYTDNSAIVTISNSYVVFLDVKGSNRNVGGIAGYVGSNTTLSNNAVSSKTGIKGSVRVGGIASTNYGIIDNNAFYGTINSVEDIQDQTYFGGIAGVNYGVISACRTNPNISILNTSTNKSSIGGIAGYNSGNIKDCIVSNEEDNYTLASEKTSQTIYIGGLAGFNYNGTIINSDCNLTSIGTLRQYTYTAGLVCFNYGGKVVGCSVKSNLLGDYTAGLVILNSANGIVDSCFAGKSYKYRANYEGNIVSGLVYSIDSGKIVDCLVNANLTCVHNNGWSVGFVSYMPYKDKVYGIIETCIANVSLNGVGTKFLDCQQDGLFKSTRTTGSIINCVISEDANVEGVKVSGYDYEPIFLWFGKGDKIESASGSNYVIVTAEQLADINTYLDVKSTDFDISSSETDDSKWYFDIAKNYAMPRAIVK